MKNLFADTAEAVDRFRQERDDKALLMSTSQFGEWLTWQSGRRKYHYLAPQLRRITEVRTKLADLRQTGGYDEFYIDIADKMYDQHVLRVLAGLTVPSYGAMDIRRLPQTIRDETPLSNASLAVRYLERGFEGLVELDLLPTVTIEHTGHTSGEAYYWAIAQSPSA